MKFIRFLLLIALSCTAFASENKHIFVGQTETNGIEKSVFLLDLIDDADLQDQLMITPDGEVYIKVDKILAIPRSEIANFLVEDQSSPFFGFSNLILDARDIPDIQCINPACRYWFSPQYSKGRKCPRCGTTN